MKIRFSKSEVPTDCERCSGKGLADGSYDGRYPGYMSSSVAYGELTMTDDRGAVWTVGRDETADEATEALEAERDRRHAEVDLRIDEMIAGVRRWDAGRPYREEPRFSLHRARDHAEATTEQWRLTKAQHCVEFLRPLLVDWQYSEAIKAKAHAVGFKPNTVERARNVLGVEIQNRDGRSYWRLPDLPTWTELEQMDEDGLTGLVDRYALAAKVPAEEFDSIDALRDWVAAQLNVPKPAPTSDFRTSDPITSEVGSSEAAQGGKVAE